MIHSENVKKFTTKSKWKLMIYLRIEKSKLSDSARYGVVVKLYFCCKYWSKRKASQMQILQEAPIESFQRIDRGLLQHKETLKIKKNIHLLCRAKNVCESLDGPSYQLEAHEKPILPQASHGNISVYTPYHYAIL